MSKLLLSLLFLIPIFLSAEDLPDANSFFGKDFVKENKKEPPTQNVPMTQPKVIEKPVATPQAKITENPTKENDDKENDNFDAKNIIGISDPTKKIIWIGAILNMHNPTHFEAKMDELLQTVVKHDLDVGKLLCVGGIKDRSKSDKISALALRGAQLTITPRIPEEYQIRSSPAWLIATSEGVTILETSEPLSNFINAGGELINLSRSN